MADQPSLWINSEVAMLDIGLLLYLLPGRSKENDTYEEKKQSALSELFLQHVIPADLTANGSDM
ncbi:uncharacterized protein N7518_008177 [Penicillium psychrosexuale]|uniref:uncharacterized protein n=1 Tax=Penicillium psychrosexuale TaxID=1002107 RepID=UPI002544ECDE|nr:uncharacterized protein N7518_008177 [Penicillium psychrosexuale]KAJ5791166.1 hypothetical protein N7518_008177 [Penicillium psychrosexuale]